MSLTCEKTPTQSRTSCYRTRATPRARKISELRKHLSAHIWIPVLPSTGRANPSRCRAANMPLSCGYITKWSYEDSNSGPLACHAARRQ